MSRDEVDAYVRMSPWYRAGTDLQRWINLIKSDAEITPEVRALLADLLSHCHHKRPRGGQKQSISQRFLKNPSLHMAAMDLKLLKKAWDQCIEIDPLDIDGKTYRREYLEKAEGAIKESEAVMPGEAMQFETLLTGLDYIRARLKKIKGSGSKENSDRIATQFIVAFYKGDEFIAGPGARGMGSEDAVKPLTAKTLGNFARRPKTARQRL